MAQRPVITNIFIIILSLICLLSSISAQAATVAKQDITKAVQDKDIEGVAALLASAGVDRTALDQIMVNQSVITQITALGPNHMVVWLMDDMTGENLWCFFSVDESGENASLVAQESYGTFATMDVGPASVSDKGVIFAVRSKQASGTGVYLMGIDWIVLDETGLKKVLSYPADGAVVSWGLPFDREFSSKRLFSGMQGEHFLLEVEFTATYKNAYMEHEGYGQELFQLKGKVQYVYAQAAHGFVLDSGASDLTEPQIAGLFSDDAQGMLRNNYEYLVVLARDGDAMQKDWLHRFLSELPESDLRTNLLNMLQ